MATIQESDSLLSKGVYRANRALTKPTRLLPRPLGLRQNPRSFRETVETFFFQLLGFLTWKEVEVTRGGVPLDNVKLRTVYSDQLGTLSIPHRFTSERALRVYLADFWCREPDPMSNDRGGWLMQDVMQRIEFYTAEQEEKVEKPDGKGFYMAQAPDQPPFWIHNWSLATAIRATLDGDWFDRRTLASPIDFSVIMLENSKTTPCSFCEEELLDPGATMFIVADYTWIRSKAYGTATISPDVKNKVALWKPGPEQPAVKYVWILRKSDYHDPHSYSKTDLIEYRKVLEREFPDRLFNVHDVQQNSHVHVHEVESGNAFQYRGLWVSYFDLYMMFDVCEKMIKWTQTSKLNDRVDVLGTPGIRDPDIASYCYYLTGMGIAKRYWSWEITTDTLLFEAFLDDIIDWRKHRTFVFLPNMMAKDLIEPWMTTPFGEPYHGLDLIYEKDGVLRKTERRKRLQHAVSDKSVRFGHVERISAPVRTAIPFSRTTAVPYETKLFTHDAILVPKFPEGQTGYEMKVDLTAWVGAPPYVDVATVLPPLDPSEMKCISETYSGGWGYSHRSARKFDRIVKVLTRDYPVYADKIKGCIVLEIGGGTGHGLVHLDETQEFKEMINVTLPGYELQPIRKVSVEWTNARFMDYSLHAPYLVICDFQDKYDGLLFVDVMGKFFQAYPDGFDGIMVMKMNDMMLPEWREIVHRFQATHMALVKPVASKGSNGEMYLCCCGFTEWHPVASEFTNEAEFVRAMADLATNINAVQQYRLGVAVTAAKLKSGIYDATVLMHNPSLYHKDANYMLALDSVEDYAWFIKFIPAAVLRWDNDEQLWYVHIPAGSDDSVKHKLTKWRHIPYVFSELIQNQLAGRMVESGYDMRKYIRVKPDLTYHSKVVFHPIQVKYTNLNTVQQRSAYASSLRYRIGTDIKTHTPTFEVYDLGAGYGQLRYNLALTNYYKAIDTRRIDVDTLRNRGEYGIAGMDTVLVSSGVGSWIEDIPDGNQHGQYTIFVLCNSLHQIAASFKTSITGTAHVPTTFAEGISKMATDDIAFLETLLALTNPHVVYFTFYVGIDKLGTKNHPAGLTHVGDPNNYGHIDIKHNGYDDTFYPMAQWIRSFKALGYKWIFIDPDEIDVCMGWSIDSNELINVGSIVNCLKETRIKTLCKLYK